MSMEQQMQQQMEASSWHELEDAYNTLIDRHDDLSAALQDILPKIAETYPEIYVKHIGLIKTVEKKD